MRKYIVLIFILFIAIFLRFWQINKVPHGFNADEAAIGYNVYSLLATGRDEHGNRWPLHFQSFNDYKPGGYFYLVLPFVWIFGLSELVVRLPSLIAGVFSVLFIYLLVRELFPDLSSLKFGRWRLNFAEIAALFLAVSPWHIHFSRGAWETNVATTLLLVGVWLFERGVNKRNYSLTLGSLFALVFSCYFYHSSRVIAPLLLLTLVFQHRQFFFRQRKKVFLFVIFGLILTLPLLLSLLRGGALARFGGVGIIGDIGPYWSSNRLRGDHKEQMGAWWVRILHNRPLTYLVKVGQNWLSHYDGEFLFIVGDRIGRSHSPGLGQLYFLDWFWLLAGFYFIFRNREKKFILFLVWLLLAPLPAALTLQSPHALRSHSLVISLSVIAAFGFYQVLWSLRKNKIFFGIFSFLAFLLFSWQLLLFLNQYLVHYPFDVPEAWEYGMKELVAYLAPIKEKYQKIYVTDRFDQPYILFLFYLKYPPQKFQQEGQLTSRDKFGFSTVRDFDKFHFEGINWKELGKEENVLVVETDEEIPDTANIIKTIDFPNGRPAFKIVEF